jgi:hypothetical protein
MQIDQSHDRIAFHRINVDEDNDDNDNEEDDNNEMILDHNVLPNF